MIELSSLAKGKKKTRKGFFSLSRRRKTTRNSDECGADLAKKDKKCWQ